jgi:hypothetical protein
MQQEDYIKRQIDQLGQALGKLLAVMLGLKSQGLGTEFVNITDRTLKNELDLKVNDLLLLPIENLMETLMISKKLNEDNYEKLADILALLGEELNSKKFDDERGRQITERALAIYEYIEGSSSTYSIEIQSKIIKAKKTLH